MIEKASKKPVANPTAAVPAILFALVLIGAGVVLGREALLNLGAIDGPEWVAPAAANPAKRRRHASHRPHAAPSSVGA